MSTDLSRGYPYELILSTNYSNQFVSVWIDWNDDFSFSDSERIITDFVLSLPATDYSAAFTVPGDATPGIHRLRARTNWFESSANPCDEYIYGEVEDYKVNVVETPVLVDVVVTVSDGLSKGPVADARIELVGTEWIGYTEEEGVCILNNVVPGIYDVLVTADNYQDLLLTGQMIWAGATSNLALSLNPLAPMTQTISLEAGWQGISSYLMPLDPDIADIFSPILPDLVIVQTMEKVYWPGQQINTIQTWKSQSGYKIKMSDDAILPLTGYEEGNKTYLLPQGWSIMPVICTENVPVAGLFEGTGVVIVKEIAGTGVYWPAMSVNTLEYLEPGNAYLILMENEGSVTYPEDPEKQEKMSGNQEYPKYSPWNIPCQTPVSHLVAIPFSVFSNTGIVKGDLIGAFTSEGICSGMSVIDENTVITVFADDPVTYVKDGFYPEEQMFFRIFNSSKYQETRVCFEFDKSYNSHDGLFLNEGLSLVSSLKAGTTGTSEFAGYQPEVFPNPTTGWATVSGIPANATLYLLDMQGQVILQNNNCTNKQQLNLEGLAKGVYMLKVVNSKSVYSLKVVVK
jgi:hypothetical protein